MTDLPDAAKAEVERLTRALEYGRNKEKQWRNRHDAALARNAELEADRDWEEAQKDALRKAADRTFAELTAERDALRAELDNLRDRVNALADERDRAAKESLATMANGEPFPALVSTGELRAIVRGSDDE